MGEAGRELVGVKGLQAVKDRGKNSFQDLLINSKQEGGFSIMTLKLKGVYQNSFMGMQKAWMEAESLSVVN